VNACAEIRPHLGFARKTGFGDQTGKGSIHAILIAEKR
jgi:hypothetical protein